MTTQNKNEEILCHVCGAFFVMSYNHNCYNKHVQTIDKHQTINHLSAYEEHFKDRIDFDSYRIFSSSVCVTTTEFFSTIEQDFTILVNHLLLEHNAFLINVNYFALYHEDSLNVDNKYIAEVKIFDVFNKVITFLHYILI